MTYRRLLSLTLAVLWAVANPALAMDHGKPQVQQENITAQSFDEATALRISQAAIGNQLGDYTFVDRSGRTVRMSDYRGKPLVISLIYTHCPFICATTTRSLSTIKQSQEALGADSFNVLTVGFDTENDIPAAMDDFAKRTGVDLPGWAFVSADADTIKKLSKDLGFVFFPLEEGGFNHITQTTFVDAQGKVYLHIYGEDFENKTLLQPLKNLIYNIKTAEPGMAGVSNKVKLFCTVYDAKTGQYKVTYGYFYGIGLGILCSLLISWWLILEYRKSVKREH
ncbi:MAG: SCO family protein [Gallionellaceae bacterium]|nr:SCO family protein [Gallionellaceae bacterium]